MLIRLRLADPSDAEAVAQLHRHVRRTSMPYLPELHTPEQDLAYVRDQVFPASTIWVAELKGQLIGFAAVRGDFLDHLYVDPSHQGEGVGSALLYTAKKERSRLDLWTFQQNEPARRFYEHRGFRLVRVTNGSRNEERVPDALYRWTGD